MAPVTTSLNRSEETSNEGRVCYLLAASSGIPATALERRFVELGPDVSGEDVQVLSNNTDLASVARSRWSTCQIVATPKRRTEIRRLLEPVQRLVLYWDGEELTRLLFEARLAQIPTRLVPIQVTRVVNKKLTGDYDVYIGRGSPWGNPFAIGRSDDGPDRADVISQYREYFYDKVKTDKGFAKAVLGLRGLRLACFCKPDACHGDIIAEYLDNIE